ncbi:MAG TPA: septum formation initiator family protein [Balneolaceae bacterium]|nr:septum formation initiator family protein [Balneolaceae bacterium]
MKLKLFNPLRWSKSFLLLIMGGVILIWFAFIDTYSLWARYKLHHRKQVLNDDIVRLKEETADLKQKIRELKNDPQLLERIAREEYGMKKEGETVYKIVIKE